MRASPVLLALTALLLLSACSDTGFQPRPFCEMRGNIHLITLVGTPYEMGRQHGEMMADEIQELADFAATDPAYSIIMQIAETGGFTDAAMTYGYPDVLEECRGMVEAVKEAGVTNWEIETCATAGYLLVVLETLGSLTGCTQVVAAGPATPDGELIHARNLDWGRIQYLLDHPALVVRHPADGIPWAQVGFPGEVFTLSGMNAEGLFVAINECTAESDRDQEGRSHAQMARQILRTATSLEEAEAFLRAQDHASAETLVISDGKTGEAAAFEMSASHMGVRHMDAQGLLWATNHYAHPDMAPHHAERPEDHDTRTRWQRLLELLPADAADSLHGRIDVGSAISVLRDRSNPYTGELHPVDLFDGGGSIANNSAIHSMVYKPAERRLYVALGEPPVPYRTFVGFSLDELFEGKEATVDPPQFE